ncbi:conserved hypothetical protein [Cupriavidus necator H16]|uniref:DUF3108 domain-containing protein n=1 Tax=Cupriavidus necator (strain ATCC 17699 / DSM 428 / KCTC 22496 / NCIMB 10442 / H16 / Stanier 337) TaxID=381666 RepID=Q0KFC3_CUPNH|nr:conserved hypothetical protein [Cupriavidus necator H16]
MPGPLIPVDVSNTPTLEAVLLPPPRPPAPPAPRPVPRPRPQPRAAAPAPGTRAAGSPRSPARHQPAGRDRDGVGQWRRGQRGQACRRCRAVRRAAGRRRWRGVRPPPSATMHYASFVNGVQNPDGLIRWEQDGSRYRLAVETRVLWFRFAFQSGGAMAVQGLLPERYEERRRNKTETSRFDAAAGTAVFASGTQAPFPPGAQDRFSVFLQLVGLVRGNPQRYATPGVTEAFLVADTRDVEPMQVQYVGEDEIDTGNGVIRAKHFVRLQRRANDRRRVELWLAQSLGWMPVRLRQTEPDGTQIDLVYRGREGQ